MKSLACNRVKWTNIVILALTLGLSSASAADLKMSIADCSALLSLKPKLEKAHLNQSQAARIFELLNKMEPAQRTKLLTELSQIDLGRLALEIKTGKLSQDNQKLLAANPGLDMMIIDFADFDGAYPTLLSLAGTQNVVMDILGSIIRKETQGSTTNADLLQSQSMAFHLIQTVIGSTVNVIQQAEVEYMGSTVGGKKGLLYGFMRWWSPSYTKIKDTVEVTQELQKEPIRIKMVDRLYVRLALSRITELGISGKDFDELVSHVLDSPDEIKAIVKLYKKIFGPTFDIGKNVAIGSVNLDDMVGAARGLDLYELNGGFLTSTLTELLALNEGISKAMVARGQPARTLKDYDAEELQLYHEIYNDRIGRYRGIYESWTAQTSNEHYEVERRYYVTVDTGRKDKDGHAITEQEERFSSDTVHPSYENILTNRYDRGDRNVTGLTYVQRQTARMAERERGTRGTIATAEGMIEELVGGYSAIINGGSEKVKDALRDIDNQMFYVEKEIKSQRAYAKWSTNQIDEQYQNDDIDNFRGRNNSMLARLENMRELLIILKEQVTRKEQTLMPIFEAYDYTDWLYFLRKKRNANYAWKTAISLATTGATASYFVFPEVALTISSIVQHGIPNAVQSFFNQFPKL